MTPVSQQALAKDLVDARFKTVRWVHTYSPEGPGTSLLRNQIPEAMLDMVLDP